MNYRAFFKSFVSSMANEITGYIKHILSDTEDADYNIHKISLRKDEFDNELDDLLDDISSEFLEQYGEALYQHQGTKDELIPEPLDFLYTVVIEQIYYYIMDVSLSFKKEVMEYGYNTVDAEDEIRNEIIIELIEIFGYNPTISLTEDMELFIDRLTDSIVANYDLITAWSEDGYKKYATALKITKHAFIVRFIRREIYNQRLAV